jgi:hypothetical protein
LNPAPLPANGVIVVGSASLANFEISVSDSSGSVAGTSVDLRGSIAWRALEELKPGSYHVRVDVVGDLTALPLDFDVEAVSRYEPVAHELDLQLVLSTAWLPGGTPVCCEPNPETRKLGEGCFFPDVLEHRALTSRTASPLPPEHAHQYRYRVVEFPQAPAMSSTGIGLSPLGRLDQWSVYDEIRAFSSPIEVSVSEYCVTVEAQSLINGATFATQRCIADPGTPLGSRPRVNFYLDAAFTIDNCPLPPEGYEVFWCAEVADECAEATIAGLADEVAELRNEQCQSYTAHCVRRPEASGPSRETGSSCRAARSPSAGAAAGWLSLMTLLAWLVRHRARSRANSVCCN